VDSTATAVSQMLVSIYTRELPKEYSIETDAVPLMHLANKYQIKSLAQLIQQGLVDRFAAKLGFQIKKKISVLFINLKHKNKIIYFTALHWKMCLTGWKLPISTSSSYCTPPVVN
jgi:hypothetical protein